MRMRRLCLSFDLRICSHLRDANKQSGYWLRRDASRRATTNHKRTFANCGKLLCADLRLWSLGPHFPFSKLRRSRCVFLGLRSLWFRFASCWASLASTLRPHPPHKTRRHHKPRPRHKPRPHRKPHPRQKKRLPHGQSNLSRRSHLHHLLSLAVHRPRWP